MIECKRCGLCCILNPCQKGHEDIDGSCKDLVLRKGKYFCSLLLDKKVTEKEILVGTGCSLRGSQAHFKSIMKSIKMMRNKKPLDI
jgi:hypothetical protein